MAKIKKEIAAKPSSVSTYIRNPKDPKQILQVQAKEGSEYSCFLVTGGSGANIIVDKTVTIYVHQDSEVKTVTP